MTQPPVPAYKRAEEERKAALFRDPFPERIKFPVIFEFNDYNTTYPKLKEYNTILQQLYQDVLNKFRYMIRPKRTDTHTLADLLLNTSLLTPAIIVSAIQDISQHYDAVRNLIPASITGNERDIICALFFKQYQPSPQLPIWPPLGYPDVPYNKEDTATIPPLCKVPGIQSESSLYGSLRPLRTLIDNSVNPEFNSLSLQKAYEYLADMRNKENITDFNVAIRRALGIGAGSSHDLERMFETWNRKDKFVGDKILIDINSATRFYNTLFPTWMEKLQSTILTETYSEIESGFFQTLNFFYSRLLNNRNQQIFLIVPSTVDVNTARLVTSDNELIPDDPRGRSRMVTKPLSSYAWIQQTVPGSEIQAPTEYLEGISLLCHFQGYRLYDMPPPPVLKSLSRGVPRMSDHVRKLYPEWTRPDTLTAWLDGVMIKWRADINKMALKLKDTLCVDGAPNDNTWHLRDVPTVQLDLYNDVLAYIAEQRGVPTESLRSQYETKATLMVLRKQGGGLRKTQVKSRGMRKHRNTRKQQRGGATGMPLAYYQDGAQMRGTTAEATGVGLGVSTNSMARTAIAQTGGFAPSIMGPMVQNGMALVPVASFMGYKMLKGRSAGRTSRAYRGPRSTHKKRRSTRRR